MTYLSSACNRNLDQSTKDKIEPGISTRTFDQEVSFMKQFTELHLLSEVSGKGVIAVSPALQARVMTSSSDGTNGRSYGWINRELFQSKDTLAHINPFGGEERFWLGPEGGQYSIFFKHNVPFDLDNWQTPALLDLEAFELKEKSSSKAVYTKESKIENYSGFTFDLKIARSIEVLSRTEIFSSFRLAEDDHIKVVGYQTVNTLTNNGDVDWKKETGLLSIWLLGMFNPSDATTIVIPYLDGPEDKLGPVVNDDYFGKVPPARLKIKPGVLFFRGDGNRRNKIGLGPARAKDIAGSYDETTNTLTIVRYEKPVNVSDYVNSRWEIQQEPYKGDVINSYNDGPTTPGGAPLGPFYELETSSPAMALKSGESGSHLQQTIHFEGDEQHLSKISMELLGVSIEEIKDVF